MPSMLRAALFAGTLAMGSWLGLGKPTVEEARAWVGRVKASADAKASAKANAAADADAKANANARGDAGAGATGASGASEEGRDLGEGELDRVPSLRPWPELNAEASIPKAWMVAEGPAYRPGSGRRLVTLTFDDGPFPETTPAVLRVLAKNNIPPRSS